MTTAMQILLFLLSFAFSVLSFSTYARILRRIKLLITLKEIDVSDLNLTIKDLNKPLPKELLSKVLTLLGYQSLLHLLDVDNKGCYRAENVDNLDATLQMPSLRG